jgi:hypothetical protein
MAEDNRTKREQETREKTVATRQWEQPDVLPMPNPEPGYEFKWVRLSTLGTTDASRAHFANITKNQMDAVDNNLMRENDPRMPIFNDRKSNVTFGKG